MKNSDIAIIALLVNTQDSLDQLIKASQGPTGVLQDLEKLLAVFGAL